MITIFNEPDINSRSLLSDLEAADRDRDSFARLIARDAIKGEPLHTYFAAGFTEADVRSNRLAAALHERNRRNAAARAVSA